MTKRHPTFVYYLASATLLALIAAYLCQPIYHPNFYTELSLGNLTLQTKQLPSLALPHASSWAFSASLAWLERAGSFEALIVYKLLSSTLLLFALAHYFSSLANSRLFGLLLASIAGSGMLIDNYFSSAIVSYIACAMLFANLFFCKEDSSSKGRLALLALSSLLYANLHISFFPAALLAILLALSFTALSFSRRLALIASVSLPAIITPHLGANVLPALEVVWNGIGASDLVGLYQYSLALTVLCLAVYISVRAQSESKSQILLDLLLVILLVFGLRSKEILPYAILAVSFATALNWRSIKKDGTIFQGIEKLENKLLSINLFGPFWLMLCFLIVNAVNLYREPAIRVDKLDSIEAQP